MSETIVVDSKLDKLEQNNRRVEADAPMSNLEAPYVVAACSVEHPNRPAWASATSCALATTRSQAQQ